MSERGRGPIVSVSGVRGVVGRDICPEDVAGWGAAFGTLCGGGPVLVGRDTRSTGPMLQAALGAGLLSTGVDVVDLGVCPTPTVQMAVTEKGARGGVIVTASHNPDEWNALKFVWESGRCLDRALLDRLIRVKDEGSIARVGSDAIGRMTQESDAVEIHLRRIIGLSVLDVAAIRAARFKVVVDACNGAGFEAAPDLLEMLGCEVHPINCGSETPFPRGTEPIPKNLKGLEDEVRSVGACAGFALDPDGDRLSLVTEKGVAVGEEYTLPLAAGHVLRRSPGPVCANLSTSLMIEHVARSHGCALHRSPVGEANVVAEMIRERCVVGGEGNGGVILPELHYGRDALVGMALVLGRMAEDGASLSSLCDDLPQYTMIKTKVPWAGRDLGRLAASLSERWSSAALDTADGIKAVWGDRWVHCRASGTEPVVRVIAEAPSRESAEALVEEAKRCLSSPAGDSA
jgi:phosphomannomutase